MSRIDEADDPDADPGTQTDIDGADLDFGFDDDGPGEDLTGPTLWDGDEGSLLGVQRDALVVLLKHEYISAETYPKEYRTLALEPGPIRSQLNNMYLELCLDITREIAYKRPVRSSDRKFRTLLYDSTYNREETLLLVFLREQFRAEGASGAAHVFVDGGAMHDFVARLRPAHDTDDVDGRKRVGNAIKSLTKAKLLLPTGSTDRFRVSRAIETLLPVERLQLLLDGLRAQTIDTDTAARGGARDGAPLDAVGTTPTRPGN